MPPTTNTVVVTQPPPVAMITSFGESPVTITCPNCHNQVTTRTQYEAGSLMWILVLVLCLIGLWPYVTVDSRGRYSRPLLSIMLSIMFINSLAQADPRTAHPRVWPCQTSSFMHMCIHYVVAV